MWIRYSHTMKHSNFKYLTYNYNNTFLRIYMIIHVVQPGETIQTISNLYNMPIAQLILDNDITNPENLVIGQTIVIVYPKTTYVIQEGDTLYNIAEKYGVSSIQLLRNNPFLSDQEYLYSGESIVINYEDAKIRNIATTGYAYPFINKKLLKKTLPYLTYLTIFNYQVTREAELVDIDDKEIIQLAKDYGVAPMMLISTLTNKGVEDPQVSNNVMQSIELQDKLFDNVINKLKEKGYSGLNIYIQFLTEDNRLLVENFITRFSKRLHEEGFRVIITVSPIMHIERTTVALEKVDYTILGQTVDGILFLTYEWGFSYGPPASATPLNLKKQILDYAVNIVPPDKLFIGFSIIGYDWQLPYIPGESQANSITTEAAIQIASDKGSPIKYNDIAQAPYFFYEVGGEDLHVVWFKDARSISAVLGLMDGYNLNGMTIWHIMYYFCQMWFIINTQYEIDRVEI